MYCTTDEVYGTTSLTTTQVTAANVTAFIRAAEIEVDRETFTTYWNVELSETAEAGAGDNELDDTGAFTDKDYTTYTYYCWIYSGTGSGQVSQILSHTDDTLTLTRDWTTNPDETSLYRIIYTRTPPYYNSGDEIPLDGDGLKYMYLDTYPIRLIEQLTIDSTSVTVTNIYQYPDTGKIQLKNTAEKTTFIETTPQLIDIDYWWGVYPMDPVAQRYCVVLASLKTLMAQIGGTHIPSTYNFPEGAVTIGQAYVNIREAWNSLDRERKELHRQLIKYPFIA